MAALAPGEEDRMERVHSRAIQLCGLATLAILIVLFATVVFAADLPALRTLCLVAAVSAFVVANVKSPHVAVGAAVGGCCFGVYWTFGHLASTIFGFAGPWGAAGAGGAGGIGPLWLMDLGLGLTLIVGLAQVAAMAHRSGEEPPPHEEHPHDQQDPSAITA